MACHVENQPTFRAPSSSKPYQSFGIQRLQAEVLLVYRCTSSASFVNKTHSYSESVGNCFHPSPQSWCMPGHCTQLVGIMPFLLDVPWQCSNNEDRQWKDSGWPLALCWKYFVTASGRIENGQWGAFLHVKTSGTATGSSAAVVYKALTPGGNLQWAVAWSNPWNRNGWDNQVFSQLSISYQSTWLARLARHLRLLLGHAQLPAHPEWSKSNLRRWNRRFLKLPGVVCMAKDSLNRQSSWKLKAEMRSPMTLAMLHTH